MRFNRCFGRALGSLMVAFWGFGFGWSPPAQAERCVPGWVGGAFGWVETPFVDGGSPSFWLGGAVRDSVVFDDGTGPALYAAGETFDGFGSGLARFDGAAWTPVVQETASGPVGVGVGNDRILALAVFDDGDGEALYAGGMFMTVGGQEFGNLAKWDGRAWSPVGEVAGTGALIKCLEVFDDGTGAALYVGGLFTAAGGVPAARVARWDGAAWSSVGAGIPEWGVVSALKGFDDGSGPALYAGALFLPQSARSSIKRFDGSSWQNIDTDFVSNVYDLEAYDDGDGVALIIATQGVPVENGPPARLARLDGGAVVPIELPSAFLGSDRTYTLSVIEDDQGKAVYLGGTGGGVNNGSIVRWYGHEFSALDGGATSPFSTSNAVRTITRFDDAAIDGVSIFVGGDFLNAGSVVSLGVVAWNGKGWYTPGNRGAETARFLPDHLSYLNRVAESARFDDGDAPGAYLAGRFDVIGGVTANSIVRWDGSSFEPLGGAGGIGLRVDLDVGIESLDSVAGEVNRLVRFDLNGDGVESLIAVGRFDRAGGVEATDLAAWDGAEWSSLPQDLDGSGLFRLTAGVLGDEAPLGPALFATGLPTSSGGEITIFRWDAAMQSWTDASGPSDGCLVFEALDDGSGLAMYAGCVDGVYRWDGAVWQPVGDALPGSVYSLAEFDDGGGPAIYAGARLADPEAAGDSAVYRLDVDRWDMIGVFSGCNPISTVCAITDLTVFDDGTGPALYAGGGFRTVQGEEASGIARWDGAAWSALGDADVEGVAEAIDPFITTGAFVDHLVPVKTGDGESLLVGGYFRRAGGQNAASLALWRGCSEVAPVCPGDLTGSGVVGSGDLGILLNAFGSTVEPGTGADLNADGIVDAQDLGLLLSLFGQPC